jgi:hypothetical protein
MKLYKALKLRKKIVGEIAKLKEQIKTKNSYIKGSVNPEKYSVVEIYNELLEKTNELIALKYVINEANQDIQEKIFRISELKSLLSFWNEVPVAEGTQTLGLYSDKVHEYAVQVDELERNNIVAAFQTKIDALQEEIDLYNYTTEIPYGDAVEDNVVPVQE